jgi:hypothetical protein
MALTYRLDAGCIVLVSQGHVEYEEGLQVFGDAITAAQASTSNHWHILFDITASEEDRSEQELRGIASFVAAHKKILSGRCAIVAADPLHFGLSRMFQAYCASLEVAVEVFAQLTEAHSWLDATD